MKVLIAYRNNRVNDNMFVKTLVSGLKSLNVTVDLSLDLFWDVKFSCKYDIIHIQWPEELFKWESISEHHLKNLNDRLRSLRDEGVKIVYTRHNLIPHYSSEPLVDLYNIIETSSSAIVHMGDFSMKEYMSKYPGNKIVQVIIAHHIYSDVYNEQISQKEARRKLKIPLSKFVILSFGKFRFKEEVKMVLKAFFKLRVKNKYLLAPRIFPFERQPRNNKLLKGLFSVFGYYVIYKLSHFFNTKLGLEKELVTDEDLPLYFIAADVVFIQRINILNSGNIPTSFLFKRVVVGPDCGNIAEILEATANPIFNPLDDKSIVAAIEEAYFLSQIKYGNKNYEFAIEHWNIEDIATQYLALYERL